MQNENYDSVKTQGLKGRQKSFSIKQINEMRACILIQQRKKKVTLNYYIALLLTMIGARASATAAVCSSAGVILHHIRFERNGSYHKSRPSSG